MIQKISPAIRVIKKPVRSLLKDTTGKLKALPGSSMSGFNPPRFYETEMIIPGGLDFKEKAYYLLTGKMPKSVYERWIVNDGTHAVNTSDQLITVERTYSGAVGDIIEPPHGIDTSSIDAPSGGVLHDISGGETLTGTGGDFGDGDLDTFEIWKHLAGVQ